MEQMFEIRQVEGKGSGCFARIFIKRGTKIMAERPLVHIRGSSSQSVAAFQSLLPYEKVNYISLHASKCGAHPTLDDPSAAILNGTIHDIYMTNSFAIAHDTESVLAVNIARVNHSCLPNAEHLYINRAGLLTLWAVKDIPAGEEITLSYMDDFKGYEERKVFLERNWNFVCDCNACDITTEFGRASDCRRVVLQQNCKDISDHAKARTNDEEKSPFRNGDRGALDAVMETLDLLRLEGLRGAVEAEYLLKAAIVASDMGDLDTAIRYMTSLVQVNASFEAGYVLDPDAAKRDLEGLIARRDGLETDRTTGRSINVAEAHEHGE